jgi:hypothetical protein
MGARGEMDDLELSAGVCTDPIQSKAKTTLTTSSWDAGDREPFPKKKPTPPTNPNLRVELRLLTPKGRFFRTGSVLADSWTGANTTENHQSDDFVRKGLGASQQGTDPSIREMGACNDSKRGIKKPGSCWHGFF